MTTSPGTDYPAIQMTIMSGDNQSGKSRRLVELALQSIAQGRQVIMLGPDPKRLHYYAKTAGHSETPDTSLTILSWDKFIETQTRQIYGNAIAPLNENTARAQLSRCISETLTDDLHPHYHAAHQASFQHTLFRWLIANPHEAVPYPKHYAWLETVTQNWKQVFDKQQRYPTPSLLTLLTEAVQNNHSNNTSLPSFLTSTADIGQTLYLDDAHLLSDAQWQLIRHWQALNPEKRQVVASLNPNAVTKRHALFFDSLLNNAILQELPHKQPAIVETLLSWCRDEERNSTPIALDGNTQEHPVTAGLFPDPIQEAQALAEWIQQQKISGRKISDPITQKERSIRWADFIVLIGDSQWEALLIDAFRATDIPVQAEHIPLDIRDVQTAVYDTTAILGLLTALSIKTGVAVSSLFDRAVNAKTSNTAQQELDDLWQTLFQSFERLLLYCHPEQSSLSKTFQLQNDQSRQSKLALQAIYHGSETAEASEASDPISRSLLLSLVNCADPSATPNTQQLSLLGTSADTNANGNANVYTALRELLEKTVLKDALKANASLGATLEKSFFDPLSTLVYDVPDLTFEEAYRQFLYIWKTPKQSSLQAKNIKTDTVRLLPYSFAYGQHAPFVCLPFLTSDGLPPDPNKHPLGLLDTSPENLELGDHSWEWLTLGISRSEHALWFSAHQRRDQQVAWPHPIVMYLNTWQWQQATEIESVKQAEAEKTDAAFEASSAWGTLSPHSDQQAVLRDASQLAISPTGMNTYLKCPRQYFYRHLLGLTEASSDSANTGLMVHRLMEVFNRNVQAKTMPHTYEALRHLFELYFDWETQQEKCLQYGFKQSDFLSLHALNVYVRSDLKQLVDSSLEDLNAKGYFSKLADLKAIEAEKAILQIDIPGLEPCLLRGKIDAIAEFNDGTFSIIDYKFYGTNRFRSSPDSVQKNWQQVLGQLAFDDSSDKPVYCNTDSNPTDYQLPLYYLALQQDPKYEGKIRNTVLQLIRPAFGDTLEKGATAMTLESGDIEEALKSHVLGDINQFILTPLKTSEHFEANPGQACDYCTYRGICEAAEALPNDMTEAGSA